MIPQTKYTRFMNRRIVLLVVIFLIWEVFFYLDKWGHINIPSFLITSSRFIFIVLLTFLITSVIIRVTAKKVYNFFSQEAEIEQRIFVTKIYTIILYFLAITFILFKMGVSLGNITLFLGIITTGLALSLQNIILSFFMWMVLLSKKPFRIGDHIKVGDDEGRVAHIGTFFVTIDTEGTTRKKSIKVPNRLFLERTVQNFGETGVRERIRLTLADIPKNSEERMQKMGAEVRKHTAAKDASVTLDGDTGTFSYNVTYFISIDKRQETRGKVIAKLYDMNRDILKK